MSSNCVVIMTSVVAYDPNEDDDDMIDNNPFARSILENQPSIGETPPQEENESEERRENSHNEAEQEQQVLRDASLDPNDDNQQEEEESFRILPERRPSKYTLLVKIKGMERIGSTSNKKENPTLIMDVQTNLPTFRKQNHKNIRKTPDEFQQLFKYLNGAIQESFIPSVPRSFTNYGINSNEDYEKTIKNFQEWFNRICEDPLILRNEEVAFFIESDFNTYSPINKSKLPATGLKRKTLKQLAPPYDETVELAEFRPLVKSIYWRCQDIDSKLSKVSRSKKILSQEENSFGQGFVNMDDQGQSHLYKKFGKILIAVGDIDSVIATLDIATLHDALEWIVKDSYVVKEALTNRHLIMRELMQAQQILRTRQDQARKLRAKRDINPLKVDEALRHLKTSTMDEQLLTNKLKRVTMNMLIERQTWLEWYENKMSNSIKEYALRKIEYERKKLTLLERIRSDVRRADTNGGLSRLGREGRVSGNDAMTTDIISQSVDGDDWTGEARRRSTSQMDKLAHTEFDKALTIEAGAATFSETQSSSPFDTNETARASESTSLDARSAATMLGLPTF